MNEDFVLLRPAWAEIDLDNLKKNYEIIRKRVKDKKNNFSCQGRRIWSWCS